MYVSSCQSGTLPDVDAYAKKKKRHIKAMSFSPF